jgi:hypothetical protein
MSNNGMEGLSRDHERGRIARESSVRQQHEPTPLFPPRREPEESPAPVATPSPPTPPQHATGGKGNVMKRVRYFVVAAVLAGGGVTAWWYLSKPGLPEGIAGGNGRLEAKSVYVATK